MRSLVDHRAGLFGQHGHFAQLALHQRHLVETFTKGHTMLGNIERFSEGAPHEPRGAHAVGESRVIDHVCHLLKTLATFTDEPGKRTFEADFTARH